MEDIKNFDDLAKDTTFSFKGKKYTVPAITNEKATELFSMGKKLKKDPTIFETPDIAAKKDEEPEKDFVAEQAEFICAVVQDEQGNPVTPEVVQKWPMKVSLAVVKLINECITGIKEDTPEEKKQ
jgi:hypothetical protein